jgi:hypothetical protein
MSVFVSMPRTYAARGSPILQRHLYFLGAEEHMGVCHNITVMTDDNTLSDPLDGMHL